MGIFVFGNKIQDENQFNASVRWGASQAPPGAGGARGTSGAAALASTFGAAPAGAFRRPTGCKPGSWAGDEVPRRSGGDVRSMGRTLPLRLAKSRASPGCSLAQRLRALESRLSPCQPPLGGGQGFTLWGRTVGAPQGFPAVTSPALQEGRLRMALIRHGCRRATFPQGKALGSGVTSAGYRTGRGSASCPLPGRWYWRRC